MNISRQQIDKLIVGTNDVSYVEPDISPTGTAVLNGPVYIGKPTASPSYEAFLNVTSNSATQSPIDRQPKAEANLAIKADGNVKIDGDSKTANALDVTGNILLTGNTIQNGNVSVEGKITGTDVFATSSVNAVVKAFDIKHPLKEEWRLRHACIEGPEAGVYYRGRLKGSNIIELPSYWKGLVDENTITVQLQSIGKHQNLVVESFNNEYVVLEVGNNIDLFTDEILIDCFYHVYGERKDGEKLIPEYEGTSIDDYPGDNSQYTHNK